MPRVGWYEAIRRSLAVPVAWISSAMAAVCLVSPLTVAGAHRDLEFVSSRYVGTLLLGVVVALGVATVAALTGAAAGAGPSLSVGAAAGVFGIPLADEVQSSLQLTLASVLLGAAVGGLLVGGLLATLEVTPVWRRLALAGLLVPVVVGPPFVLLLARRTGADDVAHLVPQPPVWAFALATVLIVLYSALSLLMEPSVRRDLRGWGPPASPGQWLPPVWFGVGAGLSALVLGFQADSIPASWLRPMTIVTFGFVLAGLFWVASSPRDRAERAATVTLVVVGLAGPGCLAYSVAMTDPNAGQPRWTWWAALAAAAVIGSGLGLRWPGAGQVTGLLLVAAACMGGWLMPASPWLVLAASGPLAFGSTMAVTAAIARSSAAAGLLDRLALIVVTGVLVGTVSQVVLVGWALSGYLPIEPDSIRSGGRVMLGLTFALSVLAAAYVSILQRHDAYAQTGIARSRSGNDRVSAVP